MCGWFRGRKIAEKNLIRTSFKFPMSNTGFCCNVFNRSSQSTKIFPFNFLNSNPCSVSLIVLKWICWATSNQQLVNFFRKAEPFRQHEYRWWTRYFNELPVSVLVKKLDSFLRRKFTNLMHYSWVPQAENRKRRPYRGRNRWELRISFRSAGRSIEQ